MASGMGIFFIISGVFVVIGNLAICIRRLCSSKESRCYYYFRFTIGVYTLLFFIVLFTFYITLLCIGVTKNDDSEDLNNPNTTTVPTGKQRQRYRD